VVAERQAEGLSRLPKGFVASEERAARRRSVLLDAEHIEPRGGADLVLPLGDVQRFECVS
jgi:hypothetical protein